MTTNNKQLENLPTISANYPQLLKEAFEASETAYQLYKRILDEMKKESIPWSDQIKHLIRSFGQDWPVKDVEKFRPLNYQDVAKGETRDKQLLVDARNPDRTLTEEQIKMGKMINRFMVYRSSNWDGYDKPKQRLTTEERKKTKRNKAITQIKNQIAKLGQDHLLTQNAIKHAKDIGVPENDITEAVRTGEDLKSRTKTTNVHLITKAELERDLIIVQTWIQHIPDEEKRREAGILLAQLTKALDFDKDISPDPRLTTELAPEPKKEENSEKKGNAA